MKSYPINIDYPSEKCCGCCEANVNQTLADVEKIIYKMVRELHFSPEEENWINNEIKNLSQS